MPSQPLLYEEVADRIARMIEDGVYRPGERIPSIRQLSRQTRVSINTVMQAYVHLENLGLVSARPQAGFYVRSHPAEPRTERPSRKPQLEARPVTLDEARDHVLRELARPGLVPLGDSAPSLALLPAARLNRMLATQTRRFETESIAAAPLRGVPRLRTMLARRALAAGVSLSPDEIIVTGGGMEAVALALHATCRPGDTVAVGSPVFFTFLSAMRWMGLRILEIPSCPRQGLNVDILRYVLRHQPVHACLAITSFNNPLGCAMPDERRRELVALLASREIPLIEDDVYGDLSFASTRPQAAKACDTKGLVLLCSSFSKTLAPGYRIGWIAAGRFQERVCALKAALYGVTPSPTQLAMAEFLANGGYERYLRALRRSYAQKVQQMSDAVDRHFPQGTCVTRPQGGYVLWVELPGQAKALRLHEKALGERIAIVPGLLFSTTETFGNCFRLNAAAWSRDAGEALASLGRIAKSL